MNSSSSLELGELYFISAQNLGKTYYVGESSGNKIFASGDVSARQGTVRMTIIPNERITIDGKKVSDISGDYLTWHFQNFSSPQPTLIQDKHELLSTLLNKAFKRG